VSAGRAPAHAVSNVMRIPMVASTFVAFYQAKFSRLKPSLAFVLSKGLHIVVAKPHFHRYLTEWDFKWNTCKMTDRERATARQDIEGKPTTIKQAVFARWRKRQWLKTKANRRHDPSVTDQ
jgi:hypothetical protein